MNKLAINNLNFDVSLEIRDIYGEKYDIEYLPEESNDSVLAFTNEKCKLFAKVIFENINNSLCIKFDCEIKKFGGYDMNKMFSAYDSVILRIYDKNSIERIMGNSYMVGEKSDCWASAYHIKSFSELPKRSASVLWEKEDTYYHLLPLCDNDFKGEIKNIDNCMCITFSPYCTGYSNIHGAAAIITWDSNPYKAAHDNVSNGFACLGLKNLMTERKRCSEIFNYLGWCSWDSFRLTVNADGIYSKIQEFKDKNIPVSWILLDDGWYKENSVRKMESYFEDKEKFPEGFSEFVKKSKEYGIKHVGIWECFGGGWNGIADDSEITNKFPETFDRLPGGIFPKTDEAGSFIYWNRRHEYLSKCGFDFLKIDVECGMEAVVHGHRAIGKTAKESLKGMEASVALYFDGACINCTGMGQEALWNRNIGMVNRNSGDFIPGQVSTMNAFVNDNIFNSFYHSYFSVTDWDMLWSDNDTTRMNVVLHAISGGLVYLSDPVGLSNRDNIMPFCTNDGKILKCDKFAMPTEDSLFCDSYNDKVSLKAWNMSNENGVLGLFNVYKGEETIECEFKISDIYDLKGDKFILYDWFNKKSILSDYEEVHRITINPFEAFLYIAVPIINGIAVVGDTDKYISTAIIDKKIINNNVTNLVLKQGGKISIYSEKDILIEVNGAAASFEKLDYLYTVDCSMHSEQTILTIKEQ